MKRVIFQAAAALFFLGVTIHAESITFEQAEQKVLNALEEQGYLEGYSNAQMNAVKDFVAGAVASKFGNNEVLNLSEQAQQAFLDFIVDAAKSAADKAAELAGKAAQLAREAAEKAAEVARQAAAKIADVAKKGAAFLMEHKDEILALAKKASGLLANSPVPGKVAELLKQQGFPIDISAEQIKGVMVSIAGESAQSQQALINQGPDAIAKQIAEKASSGTLINK